MPHLLHKLKPLPSLLQRVFCGDAAAPQLTHSRGSSNG
jgi:hypothetical protein